MIAQPYFSVSLFYMIVALRLVLTPELYFKKKLIDIVANQLKISKHRISFCQIQKRSIDARKPDVKIVLHVSVGIDENLPVPNTEVFIPQTLKTGKCAVVVGFGPAGLFASLQLLTKGVKPIIIEQGTNVHQRKRDIALMYRTNRVNERSNYCYGEGGAGTFSDGKLYTRSTKKGNIDWFLKVLIQAGASENILYDSHPHVGSDRLPRIVETMRNWIVEAGGEVHFSTQMTDIIIDGDECKGVVVNNSEKILADAVILATGHSSRAVYELLLRKGLSLLPKGFAIGVRVEHRQHLINLMQYHGDRFLKYLPPAEYKIVEQINERGVYSFCMCPGGMIVPAMTESNTIVVNGMSSSKRNSPYANSGFVVEVRPEDVVQNATAMDMLNFQQQLEQMAYLQVGNGLKAPAQLILDFMHNRTSVRLPETTYIPGIVSSPLHEWLPEIVKKKLQAAFFKLQKRMPAFIHSDAIMVGVESRTSSPIRIPRNEMYQHVQIKNLYLCGEGAGYAGGITSSARDGINTALKIVEKS